MTGLFTRALKMAMVSGWIVLPVCLLRHILRRCPKKYTVCLWALVAVRLVCPVTVHSSLSLIPQRLELAASKLATLPLGAIWLTGMGAMLLLGFFRLLRLTRRLKEAVLWKDNVWVCDYLPTPFVLGVLRPKIYLPSCLTPEDAQLVLAHEREHVRRLDALWKILAYGLLCAYWFHPLLWLAYWLFGMDVELACDQATAAKLSGIKRQKYAELIIVWAAPAAPVPGFGSHGLKKRIRTVLGYRKASRWSLPVFLVTTALVAACFLTSPMSGMDAPVQEAVGQFFSQLDTVAMPR